MDENKQIEAIVCKHGFNDYKWIDPKSIVVSQWVRMKCEYGCPYYGRIASCPPNTPTVEECKRFFAEYKSGMVIHIQKVMADLEKRRQWSAKTNLKLAKMESEVFLAGNPKAFLLFMGSCHICAECKASRADCKEPKLSRPSPEGMAVDVFTTVRQIGYLIEVLTDHSEQMNRYAFLMIE